MHIVLLVLSVYLDAKKFLLWTLMHDSLIFIPWGIAVYIFHYCCKYSFYSPSHWQSCGLKKPLTFGAYFIKQSTHTTFQWENCEAFKVPRKMWRLSWPLTPDFSHGSPETSRTNSHKLPRAVWLRGQSCCEACWPYQHSLFPQKSLCFCKRSSFGGEKNGLSK